jgi:hypothetical protein
LWSYDVRLKIVPGHSILDTFFRIGRVAIKNFE